MALILLVVIVLAVGVFGVRSVIRSVNGYNEKVTQVLEEAESNATAEYETNN
jgi:beta-lactam-binding protein with PASTA domain